MENDTLKQEIDALIAALGDDLATARPAAEREVIEKIRQFLDGTRDQRTGASRAIWEYYLPYAAKCCYRLTRLDEGWDDDLDYYASENAQFWLDDTGSLLDTGDISGAKNALGQILEATRMMKQDKIARVDILLQALDYAFEINDKKRSTQLYEAAEKLYRKHLAGGAEYAGSGWLPKIKKMGQRLAQYREKLRRYFHYAESVTVSIEAETEDDLERVIDYLQQSLIGKVAITRRVKKVDEQGKPDTGPFRARLKIQLE
jgi:hypothetical protein